MNKTVKTIALISALLACIAFGVQVEMSKVREQQAQEYCLEQGASGYVIINHNTHCIYE